VFSALSSTNKQYLNRPTLEIETLFLQKKFTQKNKNKNKQIKYFNSVFNLLKVY